MLSRKLELAGGVATGVLGLAAPFFPNGAHTFELFRLFPELLLGDLVIFIVPGLLVAIGAYLHSVGPKTRGFVFLLVGGLFLTVMMFLHIFGGVFYMFGFWGGVVILSQSLMAVLAMISSLIVGKHPADS